MYRILPAMKRAAIGVALVVGAVAALALVGTMLPASHVVASSITIASSPDTVWAVVRDFDGYPKWWGDVSSVELARDSQGREVWRQWDQHGQELPIVVLETDPPRRLVTQIIDDGLPFGGTWTYEIEAAGRGSTLTITESGEIYNPIFRVMAKAFLGYHRTMDGFLRAVGTRLGQDVTPDHVSVTAPVK